MTLRMMILAPTFGGVQDASDENPMSPIKVPLKASRPLAVTVALFHDADQFTTASKQHTPSAQSISDSDSDIDAYGGSRRALAAKKQHRRSAQPARDTTPAHGEVRFSTRKAAKVSNYNEDDEDMFDDEADMLPQTYWTALDENTPAIDAVLNHRLREDTSQWALVLVSDKGANPLVGKEVTDPGRDDFEYYVGLLYSQISFLSTYANDEQIKWQGKAHYHATWETNAALAPCRGIRRLDNYFRKMVQQDISMEHDDDIPPEEKEKWNLDRERDSDALNDYVKVERVIGMQEDDEGETEYLVKCKFTPSACLWRSLTTCRERALLRLVHLGECQPDKQYCAKRNRSILGSDLLATSIEQNRVQPWHERAVPTDNDPTSLYQVWKAT